MKFFNVHFHTLDVIFVIFHTGRNRCIPPQLRHNYATEGYVPAIMQDTTWFQNGTAQPALQNINPTLAGVTNTAKYMYPAGKKKSQTILE